MVWIALFLIAMRVVHGDECQALCLQELRLGCNIRSSCIDGSFCRRLHWTSPAKNSIHIHRRHHSLDFENLPVLCSEASQLLVEGADLERVPELSREDLFEDNAYDIVADSSSGNHAGEYVDISLMTRRDRFTIRGPELEKFEQDADADFLTGNRIDMAFIGNIDGSGNHGSMDSTADRLGPPPRDDRDDVSLRSDNRASLANIPSNRLAQVVVNFSEESVPCVMNSQSIDITMNPNFLPHIERNRNWDINVLDNDVNYHVWNDYNSTDWNRCSFGVGYGSRFFDGQVSGLMIKPQIDGGDLGVEALRGSVGSQLVTHCIAESIASIPLVRLDWEIHATIAVGYDEQWSSNWYKISTSSVVDIVPRFLHSRFVELMADAGALVGEIPIGYGTMFSQCRQDMMDRFPGLRYYFFDDDQDDQRVLVRLSLIPADYMTFLSNDRCIAHITAGVTNSYTLGSNLYREITVTLDSENHRIFFCDPKDTEEEEDE